jgi:hypothetical protein
MKKVPHENDIETMLRAYGKKQTPSRASFERTLHLIQTSDEFKKRSVVASPFMSILKYVAPALLMIVLVFGITHKKKDVAIILEAQKPVIIEPITGDELENEMALNQADNEFEATLEQTLSDEEGAML